ncbi:MAG TPA: hypothetical protein VMB05_07805 [Solirubrobacteraceae bacterium]|nr:hypothetical protein [Solirubrobacteraceae bacterium]
MSDRWFLFTQFEFPWELGPQDGRYLMRAGPEADPERVVVLGTIGARKIPPSRAQLWSATARAGSRKRAVESEPEPTPVPTARATIVDPVSLAAERQAKAWLADLDREREVQGAITTLNRVLHFHRIAAADPDVREVSPEQALVIRAGWGEGEQVADGLWQHAVELPWRGPGGARRKRIGDRAAALRPQERLAVLLGGRGDALVCEELALRARGDLAQGRLAHGAIELQGAYAMALHELRREGREDLSIRIDELQKLHEGVERQARIARGERAGSTQAWGESTGDEQASGGQEASEELDEEILRHALARLEATLRARTATGFRLK